uniref:Uncharacterized protein n=1 Tax=Picea glauca TaxID=3330 RepID=A0A117NJB0_PICGL|nr:hypothetical protein ABT39_MTgene1080 [Picea glauca]
MCMAIPNRNCLHCILEPVCTSPMSGAIPGSTFLLLDWPACMYIVQPTQQLASKPERIKLLFSYTSLSAIPKQHQMLQLELCASSLPFPGFYFALILQFPNKME